MSKINKKKHEKNNRFIEQKNHNQIKHDRSADDYSDLRSNISERMDKLNETLCPYFTSVKQKIIHMAVENIQKAFNYYFSEKTFRTSSREAEIFLKSSKELISIARFIPISDQTSIKDWVVEELTDIKNKFAAQYKYLKEMEGKLQNMKNIDMSSQNIW